MRLKNKIMLILSLTTTSMFTTAQTFNDFGIPLPFVSKKIAEHRFVSARSYDDTKREFLRIAKANNLKQIGEEINLPHVRAISFRNFDPTRKFFAINVYLTVQTGLTDIFFVEKP